MAGSGGGVHIRRLQISGGSTYTVSLPRGWVDAHGIGAGGRITVVENPDGSLGLFSGAVDGTGGAAGGVYAGSRQGAGPAASIDAGREDTAESVKRKIIAAYLRGYKLIRVRARGGERIRPEHARAVRGLVRTLMIGTEVVESSSRAIVIQVLARLPELSLETALGRMYAISVNMHREAVEALGKADVAHGEEIVAMDDEVDRFGLYVRRNLAVSIGSASILQDMGLRSASDCLGYGTVVSRIERVADHAVLIAKRVRFVDGAIDPVTMRRIAAASVRAIGVFESAVMALQRRDYEMAESVASRVRQVIQGEKAIMADVRDSSKNSGVIRFVLEDVRRTAEYAGDIAEVAIDGNIDSVITG